jgi:Ser/Thr protein kinase RdoA (MazF antagonist)
MEESRICFEHALAQHLAESGLPVAAPLSIDGNRTWVQVDGFFCEVFPYIRGRQGRPRVQDAQLAGRLLGRFHQAMNSFDRPYQPPPMQNQPAPADLSERVTWLRERLSISAPETEGLSEGSLNTLWARWQALEGVRFGDLPKTYRHGDYHLWNILYALDEPTHVAALLDFDLINHGSRIYDISCGLFFSTPRTASER